MGAAPPPKSRPSREQLSALAAVLREGLAPYAYFGVYNQLGPRLATFQDTDLKVLIGGQLVARRVHGPSDYDAWRACWDLFAVSMVHLGASTPGP